MDIDDRSRELFGRYDALRIYSTIARLSKPEFTTGQVVALSGSGSASASKEMGRLQRLALIRPVSRRGEFIRLESSFWEFVASLAGDWSE